MKYHITDWIDESSQSELHDNFFFFF